MPLVQVSLIEGRPADVVERLIAEITDVVVRVLDAPKESVRVILYDVPADSWGVGGVSKAAQ
jgi:4-oxalocrotonate tautomerase